MTSPILNRKNKTLSEMSEKERLLASLNLSKEEKWKNWWYYYKWHVVIGIIVFVSLIDILLNALGVGKVQPDYTISYVGSVLLPPEKIESFQKCLEEISPDLNGDGKVVVDVRQYSSVDTGDSDTLYYAQAAQTQLVADITDRISYFFLLEDPAAFQSATSALCNLDGSLPADNDYDPEGKYYYWNDCPELAKLDAGISFDGIAFARRGFWGDTSPENADALDELWQTFTKGAKRP